MFPLDRVGASSIIRRCIIVRERAHTAARALKEIAQRRHTTCIFCLFPLISAGGRELLAVRSFLR